MSTDHSSQIRIRPFQPGDLQPIVALWNACLTQDPITLEKFWRFFLLDPNSQSEGAFVVVAKEKPIAFLHAITRRAPIGIHPIMPTLGYITAFFVAPDYRRHGIGRKLIQTGLDYLSRQGCKTITCNGYAPYYVFPGVDIEYGAAQALMDSMGFRRVVEIVAMELPLNGFHVPQGTLERRAALSTEGTVVRQLELADTTPLLEFAEKHFSYWHQSLIDGMQQNRQNIFVAVNGQDILGFAQWENPQTDPPNGAPGRFGPFGVHPGWRSKGLGSVIFNTVVEHAIDTGATNLWFGWAGGRNLSFYERVGCHVTRRYTLFRIDLDETTK